MIAVGISINLVEKLEGALGQIFRGRHTRHQHRFVVRHTAQKANQWLVPLKNQEGMIPAVHDMFLGQRLDFGKVHHHAVGSITIELNHLSGQSDFQRIAMPVQMAALAFMIGNAMAGIEFQAAGDLH